MTVDVDHSPATRTVGLATLAGLVALLPALLVGRGLLVGVAGLTGLAFGLRRRSFRVLHAGALGLYGSLLTAGLAGAAPFVLVVGTVGGVVAWDAAEHGLGVVTHLSRAAASPRPELVHVLGTAAVTLVVAIVSYVVYVTVTAPRPTAVIVVLLAGVLALVGWLGHR